jgi:alpha-beta hydrolase superfamily lysophospholipase
MPVGGRVHNVVLGHGATTEEVTVMRREKVSFVSGADACAGYLFVPEAAAGTGTRWPCVVLAHGFSGTMDRLLPHAERFATGGIAALVFDYRGFGESGGRPRQVVDLPSQQEDLRAATAPPRPHFGCWRPSFGMPWAASSGCRRRTFP